MSGFLRLYIIGGSGGFQGVDGVNPIKLQILVGNSDREWLEAHYFDKRIKPLGSLRKIIPNGPHDPNALLDACIAFYPTHFDSCSFLSTVRAEIADRESLDFDQGKDLIPRDWNALRNEARPLLKNLNIWTADLEPVSI